MIPEIVMNIKDRFSKSTEVDVWPIRDLLKYLDFKIKRSGTLFAESMPIEFHFLFFYSGSD